MARTEAGREKDVVDGRLQIVEVIGRRLNLPTVGMTPNEAARRFSWLAPFAAYDNPASSQLTQQRLGWRPTHPDLLAELDREAYFRA